MQGELLLCSGTNNGRCVRLFPDTIASVLFPASLRLLARRRQSRRRPVLVFLHSVVCTRESGEAPSRTPENVRNVRAEPSRWRCGERLPPLRHCPPAEEGERIGPRQTRGPHCGQRRRRCIHDSPHLAPRPPRDSTHSWEKKETRPREWGRRASALPACWYSCSCRCQRGEGDGDCTATNAATNKEIVCPSVSQEAADGS